ncbi:MAG: stage II sporulation protein M [Clostridia bacterium]|nr:stage II sporulation protein M [Clostridia bacterium]
MLLQTREILLKHIKNNSNTYFFLLLAFIIGVSAGAFTVNGLSSMQRDELTSYFKGFIDLLHNQEVDSSELLRIAVMENGKILVVLWILGLTIIGIPFIFILVGVRGFITGFSSGFIIATSGMKGFIFVLFTILPKEIIIIPCIIALGVNGINFSLSIIKSKSIKHISKENIKTNFFAYCFVTLFFSCFIFVGILLEVYILPVLIRIISPIITN